MTSGYGHIHMNHDFHAHEKHYLHIWNICQTPLEKRNQFHMIRISYLTWKTYLIAVFIGYASKHLQLEKNYVLKTCKKSLTDGCDKIFFIFSESELRMSGYESPKRSFRIFLKYSGFS